MTKKNRKKAKVAKVVIKHLTSVAEDHHVLELEAEVHGEIPVSPEMLPVEVTPDAPEPEKRSWWQMLFGE